MKAKTFTFGKKLAGDNRAIERLTRSNSLFLSAAAQNNHKTLQPIYKWFSERLGYVHRERLFFAQETTQMCKDEEVKAWVLQALQAVDIGVVGLEVREEDLQLRAPTTVSDKHKVLIKEVSEELRKLEAITKKFSGGSVFPEKRQVLSLIHEGPKRSRVPFGEGSESNGTMAFFGLLGPLIHAIGSGGTLCVDELDASLHPLLALAMVRQFNDPKFNPHGSQMIFTTHDTNILDQASLRRDQIWFTEKDAEGGTHLYPLTDFKPRKNENLERGYLQGRYGAVPFVGSTDFFSDSRRQKDER